jgi:hypothetical protein
MTKGTKVSFLGAGQWETGVIENVILTRCKGVLHKEYGSHARERRAHVVTGHNLVPTATK